MKLLHPARLLASVTILLWCVLLSARAATPHVDAVDSVGIPVTDLARSRAFYTEVLGFKAGAEREAFGEPYEKLFGVFGVRVRTQRLSLGEESIELTQFLAPRGRPLPADSRSNDLWFQHVAIIVSDMDKAYAVLRSHNVAHASTAPQRLPASNPNAGGIEAFYFRDPDGNHLEVLKFPPGKGNPKWQRHGALFLGIDHTAIVVADTDRSLSFYRDHLGLKIAGTSDNFGTEQEHLNNVFGAHLRITALRAASGPGVELLEYLAPRGGRAAPADSSAIDGWYWLINLRAAQGDPNATPLPGRELGYANALILRDPDGHASLIYGSDPVTTRKNLIIVGGGFAGAKTAQLLEHRLPPEWNLTLVSQDNYITFNPLLPEVVGASILPGHVIAPHRQMVHCSHVCMANVIGINTADKTIEYLGEGTGRMKYDELVLAVGTNANLDIVKGMGQYALPLKTLGDALFLRNRVISRLEQAELQPVREHRRWLTTFVIVGGGFSGVETAGELVDFLHASLRYYKNIDREDIRIVLLHSGDRLMPELSAPLGAFTLKKMIKHDVDVRLNARAVRVTDRAVHLDNGDIIEAGTVVCTIGTQPNPLLDQIPARKERGRIAVNDDFSVPGVDGVWAAGDCAAVLNAHDGKHAPPTAQFAEAAASRLAGTYSPGFRVSRRSRSVTRRKASSPPSATIRRSRRSLV